MREVLEVFIRVCIFVDQPTFLGFVFRAISSRLDYVSTVRPADISGNVRKSSESRRKFSEVAGTFPEIPVLTKSHTFDAEKVGQYRVRVISALTQTHITVKERDLLHFLLFWT